MKSVKVEFSSMAFNGGSDSYDLAGAFGLTQICEGRLSRPPKPFFQGLVGEVSDDHLAQLCQLPNLKISVEDNVIDFWRVEHSFAPGLPEVFAAWENEAIAMEDMDRLENHLASEKGQNGVPFLNRVNPKDAEDRWHEVRKQYPIAFEWFREYRKDKYSIKWGETLRELVGVRIIK